MLITAVGPAIVVAVSVGYGVAVARGVEVCVGGSVAEGDAVPAGSLVAPVDVSGALVGEVTRVTRVSPLAGNCASALGESRESGGPLKAPVSGVSGEGFGEFVESFSPALDSVGAPSPASSVASCWANVSSSIPVPSGTPARKKATDSNRKANAKPVKARTRRFSRKPPRPSLRIMSGDWPSQDSEMKTRAPAPDMPIPQSVHSGKPIEQL